MPIQPPFVWAWLGGAIFPAVSSAGNADISSASARQFCRAALRALLSPMRFYLENTLGLAMMGPRLGHILGTFLSLPEKMATPYGLIAAG
jgi:hypothetical protein